MKLTKKQVINLMLKINPKRYNIPKKYKPHITLVYPFEDIDQKKLNEHIKKSIKNIHPFRIVLRGLQKSAKEYYLYLLVKNGKSKVMKLYRNLNSGLLKGFKNKDMPRYTPHITLGVFKTKKELDLALKQEKARRKEYIVKINSIQLSTLNKNNSIKSIKNFKLK